MPTDKKRKLRNTIAITMTMVMMLLGIAALDDSNVNPSYGADENLVDNPNYVERQILVVFNENVDRASAADIVAFALSEELISEKKASKGIKNIRDSINIKKIKTDNNMMLISLNTDVNEKAAAKEIAKNPDVDSAQPNYIYTLNKESDATGDHNNGNWYLDYIGADKAQKLIAKKDENAEKVIVASLDTGVVDDHEALSGVETLSTSTDIIVDGHGTQMAGLIANTAGKDNIKILDVDIFDEENKYTTGSITTTADVVAGIDYACRHDARIVTMAFGRYGYDGALVGKMEWAAKEDVLLIAAAGDKAGEEVWYPADYENSMGCTDISKADEETDEKTDEETGGKEYISAPGTQISVADLDGGFVEKSGTAYSAAITAGTAAMVMCADPELTADEVAEMLAGTKTTDGCVNAYKAVTKALKGIK